MVYDAKYPIASIFCVNECKYQRLTAPRAENISKKTQISLNVGNNIIEITNDIWLEEVGSQRVGASSFPRMRLWKLDQSGQPKLWRQAANGVVAAAPKGTFKIGSDFYIPSTFPSPYIAMVDRLTFFMVSR